VDDGRITKYQLGQAVDGWSLATPPGLAKTPKYTLLAADNSAPGQGHLYAYDAANQRILEFAKTDGAYVAQYEADPLGAPWLSSAGGIFVKTDAGDANPTVYWTQGSYLLSASLRTSAAQPSASAAEPSGSVAAPSASDYAAPSTTNSPGPLPTPVSPSWTSGPGWFAYKVLPGDTLSAIATKFNLQLWQLELANPQITNFNKLYVGETLYIPPPALLTQPPTTPVPS
jgi:LysM repeat protein